MLDLIPEIDNGHLSVILISHNLGVLTLVLGLVGRALRNANPFGKCRTAALAVFDFDLDISAGIRPDMVRYPPSAGKLVGFTRPKI
tara:strand:+ start:4498 stop:4755 length:258 start_codon:yes stop_codon:yes gene_type:complete